MADNDRGAVLTRALQAAITGDVDALPEVFTADVSGWSPNMLVASLRELSEVVGEREEALSDVSVQVDGLDVTGDKGFVEYRVSATFSGPFVVDDDLTVEPNGRVLVVGACMAADFSGDKISAFRNYFDNMTLLGQMVNG